MPRYHVQINTRLWPRWHLNLDAQDLCWLSLTFNCLLVQSLNCGKLPAEWKLSHIVPIPKESSKQDVRFYRPISLLPTISKCLERHIYRLLLEYLSSNQLLSDAQFGFRSGRSTVMPLLLATHQWHTTLESHKQVACVFFDLRKAFDSVPHQALLNKLHNLQVPGTLLLWLFNYLSNRHQWVIWMVLPRPGCLWSLESLRAPFLPPYYF